MSGWNSVLGTAAATATAYVASSPEPFGVRPSTAIAGLVGSVITVIVQKPTGARETLGVTVCGTACAIYGTAVTCRKLDIETIDGRVLVAAVLGLSGIFICRRVIDILRDPNHIAEILKSGRWLDLLKTTPRPNVDPKAAGDASAKG